MTNTIMEGVSEYCEEMPVELVGEKDGLECIKAWNEGGYNSTEVDVKELLLWIKNNRPDLLKGVI